MVLNENAHVLCQCLYRGTADGQLKQQVVTDTHLIVVGAHVFVREPLGRTKCCRVQQLLFLLPLLKEKTKTKMDNLVK